MNAQERDKLLKTLQSRFEANMLRHTGISWNEVQARAVASPTALRSLREMESTGGEPDVIGRDKAGHFTFCDCSAESPVGRRSTCYDDVALEARKENKPAASAIGMASKLGIDMLSEDEYRPLQLLHLQRSER
jgi:Protein of unknown function (DUF4256)